MSALLGAIDVDAGIPKFARDNGFHRDLKKGVDEYFDGRSRHANATMIVKTVTLLLWFAISYALLVFAVTAVWQGALACLSLALATAGIGFSIQHDANHGAYAKSPFVNRVLGLTLDMLGASSFLWRVKHNIAHHTYTNISGSDDDMDVSVLARLAPEQKRYPLHRFQHIYLWALYGLLLPKWHFAYDFKNLARARVARTTFKRPRGWELVEFIAGKLAFACLAFVVPAITHPFWVVALCYFAITFGTGVLLAVTFQLAHCVEDATTASEPSMSWAKHQIATTVDFGRSNRLLTWYVGGLNLQVEHHLFPKICHVHYPALAKVVQRVCGEHGVRYNETKSLTAAVVSHWRWIHRMGAAA